MARVPPLRQPIATAAGPLDLLRHLAEFWRRRDLLWHMTVRHLRGQYKQSVLGYAWAFLNPLTLLLTLSFVFSVLLRFPSQGLPYALFVLVGLLPWMFFANGLSIYAAPAPNYEPIVADSGSLDFVYGGRPVIVNP